MQISPFTAFMPDLDKVRFDEPFYEAMREDFKAIFGQGNFKQVPGPAYFIIEITSPGPSLESMVSIGLITMTAIQDYLDKNIVQHELILKKKQQLHQQLFVERKAMIKPAALMIRSNPELLGLYQKIKKKSKPLLSIPYPDRKTHHKIWCVNQEEDIRTITGIFRKSVRKAIIGDGHHRYATMARLYRLSKGRHFQKVLTVYFTQEQLKVSGFYRLVETPANVSMSRFHSGLIRAGSSWQRVEEVKEQKGYIHMAHDHLLYKFRMDTSTGPVSLPSLFSKNIIGRIFKIKDETRNDRIDYIENTYDAGTLNSLMAQYPEKYIFILPVLSPQFILRNKKILPPKSTYFLPRILNGLIVVPQEKTSR